MTSPRQQRPRPVQAASRTPVDRPLTPATTSGHSIHDSNPIPTRAVLAIAGTLLGLALLISFRTPDTLPITSAARLNASPPGVSRPVAAAGGAGGGGGSTAGGSTGGVATAGGSTGGGGSTAATAVPSTTAPTGGQGTAIVRPTATPPAVTAAPTPILRKAPSAAPAAASGDALGPVEGTPFGVVQVEVKVSNGRIVDIIALQLPSDRRRSAQISQYVAPILHDEALQAQSAQIDGISGATWTSGAYQASLQGALDKLANG